MSNQQRPHNECIDQSQVLYRVERVACSVLDWPAAAAERDIQNS